ncbi:MAG: PAS domain S-box protein [Chitinophagaceae bacterium]
MSSTLPSGPLNILVVEDNAGDFLLLKESIHMSGIAVANIQLADTLAAASGLLKRGKPDIVFLDLYLPDSSGLDSFHQLREYMTHSAVIILSGLSDTKVAREAIAGGAQDFLAKGEFDEKLLAKTILYSLERKRSVETLREANDRYNLVSKATNDLIWDWDVLTGQVFRDEKAVKKVLGLSSNALIHDIDSWNKRIHPDDIDRVLKSIEEAKESVIQESFEIEFRFLTEAGTYKYICDRGYIVRSPGGIPIRIIGAVQDITERKNSEVVMARQQALFRVLIERSPDMKILTAPDGTILYGTPAITSILGYTEAEYIGVNENEAIHPEDIAALIRERHKAIINPEYIGRIQVRVRHKKGHYRWCDKVITNLLNDANVGAVVCNFWDITQEKEAEEKIRISEEKYRQVFYDNPFPMLLIDIETLRILECNNATVNNYGYAREEFLQLTILDIGPPEDREMASTYAKYPERFEGTGNRIWRHIKKNGEEMMVEIFIATIEYGGKKVRQAQINDITEKLRLSVELEESRLRQQRAVNIATIQGQENERKQLGIELHDNINQILATAKLYLDFSMATPSVDREMLLKSKEYILLATAEIRKLSHALLPHCLEEFGLIMALEELIQPFFITGNFEIMTQWESIDEKGMKKDQKLTIYRIVQEQLNNILKHANAKKIVIALRLKEDGETLELLIKDDGKGFEPSLKRDGVGIRNIISRAALFEGKVNIDSQPGQGCELKVVFAVKKPQVLPVMHFYNN